MRRRQTESLEAAHGSVSRGAESSRVELILERARTHRRVRLGIIKHICRCLFVDQQPRTAISTCDWHRTQDPPPPHINSFDPVTHMKIRLRSGSQ